MTGSTELSERVALALANCNARSLAEHGCGANYGVLARAALEEVALALAVGPSGGAVELVGVTDQMRDAGVERWRELIGQDPAYAVGAIYLAMEYERLGSLGLLSGFGEQAIKIR